MEQAAQDAASQAVNGNWVDVTVLVILLLSAAFAFMRGFVREALSLACWLGALIVTMVGYPFLNPIMREEIEQKVVADGATALVLFCGSLLILIPLTYFLGNFSKGKTLTAIDRSLGFVFGLVRGVLVVCLIYLFLSWIWPKPDSMPNWLLEARTRPFMAHGAEMIQSAIPKDQKATAQAAREKADRINQQLKDNDALLENLSVPKPQIKTQEPAYENSLDPNTP